MDIRNLRRLVREVDAEHRRAMHGVPIPPIDLRSRRSLLGQVGAAVAGGVVAVPLLARAAAGEEESTTTGPTTTVAAAGGSSTAPGVTTTVGATTTAGSTTTAPRRPQPGDIDLLVFAQGFELALVEAYRLVLDAQLLSEDVADVARIFQRHHREHADAIGAMVAKEATNRFNSGVVESYATRIGSARSQEDALAVAIDMENSAAATHVAALGDLRATEPAKLAAAIAPVEGRHGVVFGEVLGLPLEDYVPEFQSTRDAATAAQFPSEEG